MKTTFVTTSPPTPDGLLAEAGLRALAATAPPSPLEAARKGRKNRGGGGQQQPQGVQAARSGGGGGGRRRPEGASG